MLAILGLGYVGLGLATALSREMPVMGYDINVARIEQLIKHIDTNLLISSDELKRSPVRYTHQLDDLKAANFYIVVVPTPTDKNGTPDLTLLKSACETVGQIIKKNDVVVFESTVYPGTTEEICIPILEQVSQFKSGRDFYVGYSPERINPGDNQHTLKTVPKVMGAQHPIALKKMQAVYGAVCDVIYPVSNIATAEAVKILENTQRDVNIAFMNEFAKIMHALNIDSQEVIEGSKTKWDFFPIQPGLVGGHCISIDPLYLAFQAKRHGVEPNMILTARKINDGMTQFIIQEFLKLMIKGRRLKTLQVGVLGMTYKANVKDMRNSLSLQLVQELKEYGFEVHTQDPFYPAGIQLEEQQVMHDLDAVIIAVAHDAYKKLGLAAILKSCVSSFIIMDFPGIFIDEAKKFPKVAYWHL